MKYDLPRPDEMALIYDSWASSYRRSPWAGTIPNHLYEQVARGTIGDILGRGARILCAVSDDLEDGTRRVMGYSVSEPDHRCLHWIYVKRDYRGLGCGRGLLWETVQAFPVGRRIYTHRTPASGKFLGPEWTWDPVPARTRKATP